MRTQALTVLLALLAAGAARADDVAACAKFKWSIERERTLFAAPSPLTSDGSLAIASAASHVTLADLDKVTFPAAPERAAKPGTHAAALSLSVKTDGVYDVTLSDEGWVDVVNHGQRIASSGFSGQKGCPGVRKSVRFPLTVGEYVLQLSNIDGDTINIAVVPAP